MVTATIALQMELAGAGMGWTDVSGDVRMVDGLKFDYGLGGATATDRVASTGHCTFSLNNMATNPQSATALVPIPGPIRAGGNPSNFNGGTPGAVLLGGATCIQFTGALTVAANWGIAMFSFPASYFPTAATNFGPWHYDFKGKVILPPGWCMTLTASTAWGANTAIPAMSWAEYKI